MSFEMFTAGIDSDQKCKTNLQALTYLLKYLIQIDIKEISEFIAI